MSYCSDQYPLLPNDKQAPEIQGSRPQSVKDVNALDDSAAEQGQVDDTSDEPTRTAFSDILVLFLALCFFLTFGFLFVPEDVLDGWQPGPRTIEQRVTKILTNTPLIGIFISSSKT